MSTPPLVAAPTFALVRAPIAPMHAEPSVQSIQISQTLFGHAPNVVDTDGDWHLLRTLDGYEGWTHVGYLAVLDAPTLVPIADNSLRALAPEEAGEKPKNGHSPHPEPFDPTRLHNLLGGDAVPKLSLGCTVLAGDRRLRLPLGAWVHAAQTLLDGQTIGLDELAVQFPSDGDRIVRTAARWFEGTSYQWGGVTPWGADCSGLAQTAFALHGALLPRDAWQQMAALDGTSVDGGLRALQGGDLLFFSDRDDGRITHVGCALDGARMVHLALGRGGYAVERLADASDPYVAALVGRFRGARRPTAALWAMTGSR